MACIRKRITKAGIIYLIDFFHNGKRYVKSTKTSDFALAKKILKDVEGKIARDTFDVEPFEKNSIILSDFFRQYFEYAASYKSPATIMNERGYSKKFLNFTGDVPIHTISVKDLDLWKADLLEKVNHTTFNIERRTLQAMFSVALRWELIKANPFVKVQKAKVEEKRLFLEQSEFAKVIKLIDDDITKTGSKRDRRFLNQFMEFILFSVNTGMRRSEVLRLCKADIDLDRGVIHVIKTKSKQTRVIPMNKVSRRIIESLDDDMFHRLNANHISRKFNSYLKTANLPQFKLHSLRHTFATNLIQLGVDVYTVSRLLGHSDIRTTLIYAKMKIEVMKEAVNRLTPDPILLPAEKIAS